MTNYRATSHGRRGLRFQQQIAIGVFDPRQNPQPNERSLGFSTQHCRALIGSFGIHFYCPTVVARAGCIKR